MRSRAWQLPLFWIAVGSFIGVVGLPLLMTFIEVLIVLALKVDRAGNTTYGITWAAILGIPLSFFTFLFVDVRGRVAWALARVDRPASRVAVLVGASAMVALWRAAIHVEGLDPLTRDPSDAMTGALGSLGETTYIVAVAAPLVTLSFLLGLRRKKSATTSPVLWMMVGCFVSIVGFEASMFLWNAALWVGALVHLHTKGIEALVWLVTIASPPACLAIAYACILHAPSPKRVLATRSFGAALFALTAAAIAGWVSMPHLREAAKGILAVGAYDGAVTARALAAMVAGSMMPVAAGAIILRYAHFARDASASPSRCT